MMITPILTMMMIEIESIWDALEKSASFGGFRRVSTTHVHDFYATVGADGSRGLLLVCDSEPPLPPNFDAVDVTIGRRSDARWTVSISLRERELQSIFGELCQTLLDSSVAASASAVSTFVVARLRDWHQLLQVGVLTRLTSNQLRGLVGELCFLRECLEYWTPQEVFGGWLGPLGAPQDASLPSGLFEVKVIRPGATTIRISSIDQLDVPATVRLTIAVVTLLPLPSKTTDAFTARELIDQLAFALKDDAAAREDFDKKLRNAGIALDAYADTFWFRLNSIRYFAVSQAFPRITRSLLPNGISEAHYDITLAALIEHETTLELVQ